MITRIPIHSLSVLCISLFASVGCTASESVVEPSDSQPTNVSADTQLTAEAPEQSENAGALADKIKFKGSNGETAFSVKPEPDGAKLVDEKEKEIARFNLKDTKLKIKDADDVVLAYVIASNGKYKIENAEQSVELWKLQAQADGDWKLEDGNQKLIYKIKKRDYGYEIEDDNEASLFKAKLKDGKTSLRNSSDSTVLYTKDPVSTLAFTCHGLKAIDSEAVRTGLMVLMILHPPK